MTMIAHIKPGHYTLRQTKSAGVTPIVGELYVVPNEAAGTPRSEADTVEHWYLYKSTGGKAGLAAYSFPREGAPPTDLRFTREGDVPAGFKGDEQKLRIVTATLIVQYIEATCAVEPPPTGQIDWGTFILEQADGPVGQVLVEKPTAGSGLTSVEHWILDSGYKSPGSLGGGAYTLTHVSSGFRGETRVARPDIGGESRARPQSKAGSGETSALHDTVFIVASCREK